MSFRAPYLSKEEISRYAEGFLDEYHPKRTIPVPIEYIVESRFSMDIVPVPGLQTSFDIVAFITKDMCEIRVDEYVYMNRINRYRFSLAHELAHKILHSDLWEDIQFHDVSTWKAAVSDSIPEKEYSFIEFHANLFAGLILVPQTELESTFSESVKLAADHGFDVSDEVTRDYIASYLGKRFEVSPSVIHRRLEADKL